MGIQVRSAQQTGRDKMLIVTGLLPLLLVVLAQCAPRPVRPCDPAPALPLSCTYGTAPDSCGRPVCLKGPGGVCGGRYGQCGESLQCSLEGHCEGCSFQTFLCWENGHQYSFLDPQS